MAKRSGKRNYFGEEATTGINPPKRHHPELDQIEGSSSSTLSSSQSSGSGTTKMRKIKKTKGKKEILVNRKAKKAREGRREQRKFMHGGIEVPWVGREIEIVSEEESIADQSAGHTIQVNPDSQNDTSNNISGNNMEEVARDSLTASNSDASEFYVNMGHMTYFNGYGLTTVNVMTRVTLQQFELLQMLVNIGSHPSYGLTHADLQNLPSRKFEDAEKANEMTDNPSCAICQLEFENGEEVRTLPCCHQFHQVCVDRWLKDNRTCPMCRCAVI